MVTGKVEEKRPKAEAHYAGLARSQNRPKEHLALQYTRQLTATDGAKQLTS